MTVQVMSFVAMSGTGKTTLIERVIAELKSRGWRVGALKHDAHGFEIDQPGKDSWRFTQAGADTTLIVSSERLAVIRRHDREPPVHALAERYFDDVDILIVEGFKQSSLPKIEVHRAACSATLLCRGETHDDALLAIASDEPLEVDVPVIPLDDITSIVIFLEERLLGATAKN